MYIDITRVLLAMLIGSIAMKSMLSVLYDNASSIDASIIIACVGCPGFKTIFITSFLHSEL